MIIVQTELIFGPNLSFLNWNLADFQAWEHEKLPNLAILAENSKILKFLVKRGALRYAEKGGLVAAEGLKKGVLSAEHPYHPFQGKYPPRANIRLLAQY